MILDRRFNWAMRTESVHRSRRVEAGAAKPEKHEVKFTMTEYATYPVAGLRE